MFRALLPDVGRYRVCVHARLENGSAPAEWSAYASHDEGISTDDEYNKVWSFLRDADLQWAMATAHSRILSLKKSSFEKVPGNEVRNPSMTGTSLKLTNYG